MADIELVIKIPEEAYKHIMSMQFYIPGARNSKSLLEKILKAIRTGTLLSKGHGRLIVADEVNDVIYKCFDDIQCYDGTGFDIYQEAKESIDKIHSIIEADKE